MNEELEPNKVSQNKEALQLMAFEIISNAGEAFDYFYKAVEFAETKDFAAATESLKHGNEALNKAHKSQTGLLVAETNNDELPYSILMVHAQDHLTMAIFAGRMAKLFINLWKEMDKKNG
ncbi:PTS lactose/cellobiose transporter subunit IIA [Enterococcus faecium]